MVTLGNANINNLEKLVEQNKDKSHESKCTYIKCVGVRCTCCPMSQRRGVGATLGEVRAEVAKRKLEPTESRKGGHLLSCDINLFNDDWYPCTCNESKIEPTESHKGGGGCSPEWSKPKEAYTTESTIEAAVYSPKHYAVLDDIESIQVIARSMTVEQFKGFCLGNIIKYRLRLGAKDAVEQDLKKAENYKTLFDKYKELCHE